MYQICSCFIIKTSKNNHVPISTVCSGNQPLCFISTRNWPLTLWCWGPRTSCDDGRRRCGDFTNDVIVMWSSEGITEAALAHYYETTLNAEGYSANAPPLLSIIVMWPCKGWETERLPASTPVTATQWVSMERSRAILHTVAAVSGSSSGSGNYLF